MELKVPKIAIFGVKGVPYGGVFQMGVHGLMRRAEEGNHHIVQAFF